MKGSPIDGQNGPGTVVGANVALSGTLKDQNDISVHGMVEGEVISESAVSIGETAQVKGPVRGRFITIAGVVRGEIEASEKLEIMATGKVFGGILTKDLVVHSGAAIVGKVMMGAEEEPAEKAKESTVEESGKQVDDAAAALSPDEE
jgi:cytoskeletal protein CcmA (bactofilin family)